MTIDERIFQLLVPNVVGRMYPLIAPDKTPTPYTTYMLMNGQNLTTHDTPLPQTRMWHVQFNSFSEGYGIARVLSNQIQDALVGYADAAITGVTPIREQGSYDDIAKLYGWTLEVLVTEQLA